MEHNVAIINHYKNCSYYDFFIFLLISDCLSEHTQNFDTNTIDVTPKQVQWHENSNGQNNSLTNIIV